MAISVLGSIALLAYLALLALTTHRLWRSAAYDLDQKVAQTATLWVLPILGVVLVRAALADAEPIRSEGDGMLSGLWAGADPGPSIGGFHAGGTGSHGHCDAGGHHGGGFDGGGGCGGGDGGGGGGFC